MFTQNHFIWLCISASIIGVLLFLSLKQKWNFKKSLHVMCIVSIASEITKIFSHIQPVDGADFTSGGYMRAVSLPFHLCSICIFIFFYLALSKNEVVKEKLVKFFVPVGLFGGFLALIMATSGVKFDTPDAYQSFIYHAVMFWFALYIVITKQVTYTLKDLLFNILYLFCLSVIMIWINGTLITAGCNTVNFCFIVRPPADGLPFLTLKYGWHVYFAHLSCCGIILETAVALPYIVKGRKQKA